MSRRSLRSRRARAVPVAALLWLAALAACEPRRDVADMAVGLAPFEELRGLGFGGMRAGVVRAFRPSAARAPLEGFREVIGAFDVVYTVPGYAGTDSTWPNEDAIIEEIEASRAWPSDSLARAAYDQVVSQYSTLSRTKPACYTIAGQGFTMRQAEWALGDGFAFTASFAPRSALTNSTVLPALHSLAVRRRLLRDRLPAAGAPNPDDHPVWQPKSCDE